MKNEINAVIFRKNQALTTEYFDTMKVVPTEVPNLCIYNCDGGRDCSKGCETLNFKFWMNGKAIAHESLAYPSRAWLDSILKSDISMHDMPIQFVNGAYCAVCANERSVLVFNDFMGLFPVYYHIGDDAVILSSSLKSLKKALCLGIDEEAVFEYESIGYNYSYSTIYKGIKVLPPASRMLVDRNGDVNIEHYATMSGKPEVRCSMDDLIAHTETLLKQCVNRIYSPDNKYSLSITGGMDSRLIFLMWPDRERLLTETAGRGTSDYLKAREIIGRIGSIDLHALEDLKESHYAKGFKQYYDECDNPLLACDQFNYYHLKWKISRGSDIHLSGVGGELLDGENLYLSRKPYAVMRESVCGYNYRSIHLSDKRRLIAQILGIGLACETDSFIDGTPKLRPVDYLENAVDAHDTYLGVTKYAECYTERFRTYRLANAGFKLTGLLNLNSYFCVMPFNDRELIQHLVQYHPMTRELRKLAISILRRDALLRDVPTDTTHLPVSSPYVIQRFMRSLRMVTNIGFQKKIPLLQKGDAPKFRAFPYFDRKNHDLRNHIRETITNMGFVDKKKVNCFLNEIDKIEKYNFYIKHGAEGKLLKLYRLARALED